LFFRPFSFGHIMLSVLLRITASDYHFDILNLKFYSTKRNRLTLFVALETTTRLKSLVCYSIPIIINVHYQIKLIIYFFIIILIWPFVFIYIKLV
jgi:hypothetical protein